MRARLPAFLGGLVGSLLMAAAARGDGSYFNAVYSRDALDVLAVGDSGAVYRSFDGGANWTSFALGDQPLRGVLAHGFTIVVVADSGEVWRSMDSGGNWSLSVMGGAPRLTAIASPGGNAMIAVGSGGTVLRSTDAGASWSPQSSGTSEQLNAVQFLDAQTVWIAGTHGFLARSGDGGSSWTPVTLGTTNDLNSVAAKGAAVWVVGDNATAYRSADGGASFAPLNLHADASPDVKKVWLAAPDTVFLTGGGGFLRRSDDSGATWAFLPHTTMGQFSDLAFVGPSGWAACKRQRTVMRTVDRGTTWLQPTGAVATRTWKLKMQFTYAIVRGNTFAVNPFNKHCLYVAAGDSVFVSRDEGETWNIVSTIPEAGVYKTNAFVVSPRDSNTWVAAVGPPDHVVISTNGGATWSDAANSFHDFGEYGVPLEQDPDHPDTLYFGPDNSPLYWSTDAGATWAQYSNTVFRSPCGILVVPESDSAVVLVADGVTGQGAGNYFRATSGSRDFANQWSIGGSEIPGMATSRLRNTTIFGTNWANGGVERSTDRGLTWPKVHTVISAWGVDVARDDPTEVMFIVFSGTTSYLSFANGDSATFTSSPINGADYGVLLRDRALALALESNGVWKLDVTQTMPTTTAQNLTVTSPNGGESWPAGSVHNITWSSANVALARIEYRAHPTDAWQLVALDDGYRGSHAWTVPYDLTTEASIRVSDAWDASPTDTSDQPFTIAIPLIAEGPASLGYGSHPIGSATLDTIRVTNPGTGPLTIASIATAGGAYRPGRASLSLAPGASDTVGVTFLPSIAGSFPDTLVLASNANNTPTVRVPLSGVATDTLLVHLVAPVGGEAWQYGTTHAISWQSALVSALDLAFETSPAGPWIDLADSLPPDHAAPGARAFAARSGSAGVGRARPSAVQASNGSYSWQIPNLGSAQCRVRLRQHGGGAESVSPATFSITVPSFAESLSPLAFGNTRLDSTAADTIHIANSGTAPLTLSSATSSDPHFWLGRSSLVIPAGGSDSLGIFYHPTAIGTDTTTITLLADDPVASHSFGVHGHGVAVTAVGAGPAPTQFALWQNLPNPFTVRTTIRYALPVPCPVSLEVFDLQGHRTATLVRGNQGPGTYTVPVGAGAMSLRGESRAIPAGIYFYRLRAGSFSAMRKMVVMP